MTFMMMIRMSQSVHCPVDKVKKSKADGGAGKEEHLDVNVSLELVLIQANGVGF